MTIRFRESQGVSGALVKRATMEGARYQSRISKSVHSRMGRCDGRLGRYDERLSDAMRDNVKGGQHLAIASSFWWPDSPQSEGRP